MEVNVWIINVWYLFWSADLCLLSDESWMMIFEIIVKPHEGWCNIGYPYKIRHKFQLRSFITPIPVNQAFKTFDEKARQYLRQNLKTIEQWIDIMAT